MTLSPPLVSGAAEPSGTDHGRSNAAHAAGLIGFAVLAQFVITLDERSTRGYFEPRATPTLPAVLRSTGLIVDKPDHDAFEVLDTLPGSAAERAGLRGGDRIVAVAGQPARDLSTSDVLRLSAPQDHIAVATADHRHFELAISQVLP